MSRQQIHGQDRRPSRMQFHAPVRYENIRGPWRVSIAFEAPVIVWGDGERCFAYLHDFDPRSLRLILDSFRQETYERRGAYLNPFCHEGAY
jgi:hypothetical protein